MQEDRGSWSSGVQHGVPMTWAGTHPAVEAWAVKAPWGRGHWTSGRNCTCCFYRALLIKEIRNHRVLGTARKNVLPDSVRVINLTLCVFCIHVAELPKAGYPQMWLNCVLTELENSYKTWTTQHTTVTISGHALKALSRKAGEMARGLSMYYLCRWTEFNSKHLHGEAHNSFKSSCPVKAVILDEWNLVGSLDPHHHGIINLVVVRNYDSSNRKAIRLPPEYDMHALVHGLIRFYLCLRYFKHLDLFINNLTSTSFKRC